MSVRRWLLTAAVPVGFGVVLVLWPLLAIGRRGLAPDGAIEWSGVADTFASPRTRSVITFTLVQAAWSTVVTMIVGLPAAWSVSRHWWGARWVRALVTAAFVLPTVVMALAWRPLLDRGLVAIVVAHVAFNVAVVVRVVGPAWANLDPAIGEVARTMGADRVGAWWTATRPGLAPAIGSAGLLTFLFSFTSYGIVLFLGRYEQGTLETEIARQARALRFDRASALVLVQLAVVAIVAALNARAARSSAGRRASATPPARARWCLVAAMPAVALVAIPLASLTDRVVRPDGHLGLASLRTLGRDDLPLGIDPLTSLRTSMTTALAAAAIALVVGGLTSVAVTARRDRAGRALDAVLMLPLGVSAVTLGYGYLVTFDEPPLALRDRAIMIPLVHAVVGVPFVVRLLVPARRAIAPAMREAAATMGATPLTVTRTIVVPLLAPALAAAAGFAVVLSLGEFGATSMLVRRGPVTAPIAIGQWLGVPGEVAQHAAYALAAVLAAGAVLVMVLTDVWSARAGRQSS